MKHVLFTLLVGGVLLFSSCAKNSPEAIAEDFLTALDAKNYDKAKSMGTEGTKQLIDMIKGFSEAFKGMENTKEAKREIKNLKCTEEGDAATCTYCCDAEGKDESIELVKENGKWLVDMKKDMPSSDDIDLNLEEGLDSLSNTIEESVEELESVIEEETHDGHDH